MSSGGEGAGDHTGEAGEAAVPPRRKQVAAVEITDRIFKVKSFLKWGF
ncbi:hypothetical protein [Cytobacillus firmus]|jgi:hypothetical protein|nr:hypothetical protein [Cytobacillus firmus]